MKNCIECGEYKPLSEYYNYKRQSLKQAKTCKVCLRAEVVKKKGPYKGYVYVLTHPRFDSWVKVGRTTNVSKRLDSYNTGCPLREYQIEYFAEAPEIYFIELFFKDNIESNGYEWYNITVEEAVKIIKSFK